MASDGIPVNVPVTRLVHGSQAQTSGPIQHPSGKTLPPSGKTAPAAPSANASKTPDWSALLAQLNRHINRSGQPDQFRLNTNSGHKVIQQINPESGEVVAEYLESEFPALAEGLGGTGLLVNTKA